MASWPQGGGSASAIRGVPVASTTPTTGQVLAYDGTQYAPAAASSGLNQLTGDVTAGPGTGSQAATVARLQGRTMAATAPTTGQYLGWDGTQWAPSTPTDTGITRLTGDVAAGPGNGSQAATVAKIQGVTISSTAPTTGQVLTYSGTQWAPATPAADTGITQLTGDVTTASGSGSQAATVAKLQGRTVATTSPTNGQALVWVSASSQWAPGSVTAAGSASGDLSGSYPSPTVSQIQGRAVASTAPTSGQAIVWSGSQWAPAAVVQAGAFASSGLTGGALSIPYFAANGSATTLQAPATKTNQVLGWDAAGNLAWVGAMASVALFAGSQYVTDTYIIERYDVALECPAGIVTLDGTGIDTATGIV